MKATVPCSAPSGASTGTSAAVAVALPGALDWLGGGGLSNYEMARGAQRVETDLLGQQCGIQDQIASAFGGINYIEMTEYPHASVTQLVIAPSILEGREDRLCLFCTGISHNSPDVHSMVIRSLESEGADSPVLRQLRVTAAQSRDAIIFGDFPASRTYRSGPSLNY